MQKIIPHLWFDKEAKEATAFYATLFPDSAVNSVTSLTSTPSGDTDIVNFTLAGQKFMAISAGPYFKLNPAISFMVACESEAEIDELWAKLSEGGKVLMEYQAYPWAKKYGWVQDKFGLSWQLMFSDNKAAQKITPVLMFTQHMAGKAKEAIENYVDIFPNSKIEMVMSYGEGEGDTVGFLKHAQFTLNGEAFAAMDSSGPHEFVFNEAVSLIVKCKDQEEIDYYWDKLSAVPESEQCGWVKDKFGVSWQITPTAIDAMMGSSDKEAVGRVTHAFLKMKKFNIAELEQAFKGE